MSEGQMELKEIIEELASGEVGLRIYPLALDTVRRVLRNRQYPPSYSPTGQWDEEGVLDLTHHWLAVKLIGRGHLPHLVLTNGDLHGLRRGLELSFTDFLISQRKQTELDHLFRRANAVLEDNTAFRCIADAKKKAARIWALARWDEAVSISQVTEEELLTAAFNIRDIPVIRYRADSKKLSPVVSDTNLAAFLDALLTEVARPLSLSDMTFVFRYRFHLLEADVVSLDESISGDDIESSRSLHETISSSGPSPEDLVVREEVARLIVDEMSERQQRVLLEYAQPDATLTSVGESLGVSKSTIDNELRRTMALIQRKVETADEAEEAYARILEILSSN